MKETESRKPTMPYKNFRETLQAIIEAKVTITEASKSQIEARERAVEQATKNKDKTYDAHTEAQEAFSEAQLADDHAGKVKRLAIEALAAARAENSRKQPSCLLWSKQPRVNTQRYNTQRKPKGFLFVYPIG